MTDEAAADGMSRNFQIRKYFTPLLFLVVCWGTGCQSPEVSDTYVGYVEGEYVYVAASQSGWIEDVYVSEGDSILAGDPLFELDTDRERIAVSEAESRVTEALANATNRETGARPEEIEQLVAQLSDAEAQLAYAQTEYNRIMPLLETEVVAPAEGDRVRRQKTQAEARVKIATDNIEIARLSGREAEIAAARAVVETAEASASQARWNMDQRSILARVEGRVEARYRRKGEFTSAGLPVLSILPFEGVKVRFFVPQNVVSGIAPGDIVHVHSDLVEDEFEAIVSFVSSSAEFTPPVIFSIESREKLVFLVEARISDSEGLRPGVPVDVRVK